MREKSRTDFGGMASLRMSSVRTCQMLAPLNWSPRPGAEHAVRTDIEARHAAARGVESSIGSPASISAPSAMSPEIRKQSK